MSTSIDNIIADAVAYHSHGAGRGQYSFDFQQQEAYFWSRFGETVNPDICKYLEKQITMSIQAHSYSAIILNQIRSWPQILRQLPLSFSHIHEKSLTPNSAINLFDILPSSFLSDPAPLAFVVSNIAQMRANKFWMQLRNNPYDIVLDNYANLISASDL